MDKSILIIDDDAELLTLLKAGLEHEGYTVITAESGREGIKKARESSPDLIILDIVMPGIDGWQVCQQIRRTCDTPIIMFTASASAQEVARGYELGVDDYVTKPCKLTELKERVHRILRQKAQHRHSVRYITSADGRLFIDFRTGIVLRAGKELDLSPTESRLLVYLASRRGQIISPTELLTNVWGPDYAHELEYLSVYISHLCRKLGDDPAQPVYIRAHPKAGYSFCGSSQESEHPYPPSTS